MTKTSRQPHLPLYFSLACFAECFLVDCTPPLYYEKQAIPLRLGSTHISTRKYLLLTLGPASFVSAARLSVVGVVGQGVLIRGDQIFVWHMDDEWYRNWMWVFWAGIWLSWAWGKPRLLTQELELSISPFSTLMWAQTCKLFGWFFNVAVTHVFSIILQNCCNFASVYIEAKGSTLSMYTHPPIPLHTATKCPLKTLCVAIIGVIKSWGE